MRTSLAALALALACRQEASPGGTVDSAAVEQVPAHERQWAWDTWRPEAEPAMARGPIRLDLLCPADPVDPWDLGFDFVKMDVVATDAMGRSAGVAYDWNLWRSPEGAYPAIYPAQGSEVWLHPLVVGDYELSVRATTSDGAHEVEQSCALSFAPARQVHIELAAGLAEIQYLLHVIAYGGSLFERGYDLNSTGDCHDVEWGRTEGEPEAARIQGSGEGATPYQIVRIPALEDTSYQIAVHVEDDLYSEPNPAGLRIWVDGELLVEEEITLLEGEVWVAGTLDGASKSWTPDGRIEPLGPIRCW